MTSANVAGRDTGDMFAAIDAGDADKFVDFLSSDAVFRFGSAPPVQGRDAIHAVVSGFFTSIAGSTHTIHKTISEDNTLVCEGEVSYRRPDNSEITLPFTDVLEYDGDLISHYKIYLDIAPLYAE